jgi:hypothetical protein
MDDQRKHLVVVGFDLGDGESAVAECQVAGTGDPDVLKIVDNRQSFLTCIGRDKNGQLLIGQAALSSSNASTVRLTFKRRPNAGFSDSRELAKAFFQEVILRVANAGCPIGDACIVVGHPSAWSIEDVESYTRDLRGDTGWSVLGISESRAAFLQLKESRKLTVDQLRSRALIVDVGSSTTDFTLIDNLKQEPVDFGHNDLGGRLIDRAILRAVISRHPEKEKIGKILSEYSHIYAQCEHLCRIVKESFFIAEANGVVPNGPIPSNQLVEIDEATDFRVRLTATQMRDIIMAPQEELSGSSWPETFRTSLRMVKDRAEKMNGPPATVALTGGGARMGFVRELCQSVFPEAFTLIDSSPEFTIAKGLARAGKLDLLSTSFFQELGPLRDALLDSLKKTRFSFIDAAVGPMADDFVAKVVRQGLESWREGRVSSLNDLANHLRVQGECWARSPSAERIVREATNAWSQRAMLDIAPHIRDISHRYGLPYESLKIDIAPVQSKQIDVNVHGIANDAALAPGMAAGGIAAIISLKIAMMITPIIVAILVKSTIITAAVTGPVGWIVGAVIVGFGFMFGKEKAEDLIKSQNLPAWLRKTLLSDAKIDEACASSLLDIQATLKGEMDKATYGDAEMILKATEVLRDELAKKMQEAIVLIGR